MPSSKISPASSKAGVSPQSPRTFASIRAAKRAGLRYVTVTPQEGITRKRSGKSFSYFTAAGRRIRDARVLDRIRRLAIPPAYSDVWICPDPDGHMQAVGLDQRGRKQYRYHARWREVRDSGKFARMREFARALPVIRRVTRKHLTLPGLPREKVLAAVVQLLERTLIRVGNEEYAQDNDSYGLTTLRDKHVRIRHGSIRFRFRGKSKVHHALDLKDARLARIVQECRDLPGQELFQYIDENGNQRRVTSDDVNRYLQELTGEGFTAKDFRTWQGTVLAFLALKDAPEYASQKEAKSIVKSAIQGVSLRLRNTIAVCRKCYVHPAVIEAYLKRKRTQAKQDAAEGWTAKLKERKASIALDADELEVVRLLEKKKGTAA
jgi:DNA topoisomerase-1